MGLPGMLLPGSLFFRVEGLCPPFAPVYPPAPARYSDAFAETAPSPSILTRAFLPSTAIS
jgi:hypothetical protein